MNITPEQARKIRLKKSKLVELCDGELQVRIAGMLANAAFDMSEKSDQSAKGILASKALLFIASCITEEGDALFKDVKDVEKFLGVVDIDDATRLLTEITAMSRSLEKKMQAGNSEGTPAPTT